ncbi:hypothetical protein [Saccharospirillum alexandrii]|uniref:hypothetical protein n=1 Tax=Saccharospirillum alexandrii TaxID=2448477 RepID=UPI000FDB81DF|nr:hypothetical protein [Saccharospirillum alexandrii]
MIDVVILLDKLSELASKELQENLWLHGNENQMSSFTEAICGVFDDARLTRSLETGYLERNFSNELCRKTIKLDQAIKLIPEDLAPEDIIKHPKMKIVRLLASELLVLFESETAKGES